MSVSDNFAPMSNRAWGHGRATTVVAALAAVLTSITLSACSPDPPPDDGRTGAEETPTPTSAAGPTSTMAPVPPGTIAALPDGVKPTRPAELDGPPSLDAAKVIAPYFLQLVPYGDNTGDTAEFEALSHPDCVFCRGVLDEVAELKASESHVAGGGLSISDVSALAVDPASWFTVDLVLHEDASRRLSKFDTLIEESPGGGVYDVELIVVFDEGRWLVRELSHDLRDA